MTKKTVNYTATDIEQLTAGYDPTAEQDVRKAQVKTLAAELGRKDASIIAKLVNLDLYVKMEHVAKDGSKSMSKEDRVTAISKEMGVDNDVIGSLVKANVSVIKMVQELVSGKNAAEHNLSQVLDSVEAYMVESE